jgi:hypothetical protein
MTRWTCAPFSPTEAVTQVIRRDGERLQIAFAERDAVAVAECIAADAVLLPPASRPLVSRAAITAYVVDRVDVLGVLPSPPVDGRAGEATAFAALWRRRDSGWVLVADAWSATDVGERRVEGSTQS